MNIVNLNLARKWRSKIFDEVIGQETSLRILKNSLYLDHYFPLYLFSGQRGCGKTTTARIFASALNCKNLVSFQQDPKKYNIPCLVCESCIAMHTQSHPDFIEIDAASHTGVDNVRNIIETASFLPVMGTKKIYLIDEAHMLSKSAFNAFLKILEEPPVSVLFMLATTDVQKILDTVRSRSFQLFFKPIPETVLLVHLASICNAERIEYDDAGLEIIIKETDGSARDALNLLEQVRFAAPRVTKAAVLDVLGHLDDERIIELLRYISMCDEHKIILFFTDNKDAYNVEALWYALGELLYALLLLKYAVSPVRFMHYEDTLKTILTQVSVKQVIQCMQLLYDNESLFLKTAAPHQFCQMIVLRMCQQWKGTSDAVVAEPHTQSNKPLRAIPAAPLPPAASTDMLTSTRPWDVFVHSLAALKDPLLISIFSQAAFEEFQEVLGKVVISFAPNFMFFNEKIDHSVAQWKPLLEKSFGRTVQLQATFEGKAVIKESVSVHPVSGQKIASSVSVKKAPEGPTTFKNKSTIPHVASKKMQHVPGLDISDTEKWKKTHTLLRIFPGTITEIEEGINE